MNAEVDPIAITVRADLPCPPSLPPNSTEVVMSRILVTGAAGFIGMFVAQKLLARGDQVLGIDNLNDYYDPALKEARLQLLSGTPGFAFTKLNVADRNGVAEFFERERPEMVVHLAAQAGVRYSLENPAAYIDSNLVGFGNILEGCRRNSVRHLVFASTSSVYGANTKVPFSEHDNVDHPVSLYAATKKANELMAHFYSHLFRLPCTGLRFFTVYGPWGRPDMAPIAFTNAIVKGEPIKVFNRGKMRRDFTYVEDVAEGVVRTLDNVATPDSVWNSSSPDPATSNAPYRIYNIGNSEPVELLRFIDVLESCLGKTAIRELLRYNQAMYRPPLPTPASSKRRPAFARRRRSKKAWRDSSSGIASITGSERLLAARSLPLLVRRHRFSHDIEKIESAELTQKFEPFAHVLYGRFEIAMRFEIGFERPVFSFHLQHLAGIVNDRLELFAIANQPRICHQAIDIERRETRNHLRIEPTQRFPGTAPFLFDDAPGHAGLKRGLAHNLEII